MKKINAQEGRSRRFPLAIRRFFTKKNKHPFDDVAWEKRDVTITKMNGAPLKATGLEFPAFWSQNASHITASKYFRGRIGTQTREMSVRQMITRVAGTIRGWGENRGYFAGPDEARIFEEELTYLLVNQKASFNSPVWFNVGMKEKPQCSACFILDIEDNMHSILDWIKTEGMIFKGGSGSGINLSPLRSKDEELSVGGYASGPVSFMRGADSVAGMIASGGATRRAAKMVVLNIDHPDALDFIRCKAEEEKKIRALMAAGYDMRDLNNKAWCSIQYQNANNSVRVSDDFMKAVERNGDWSTHFVTDGKIARTYKAKELLREIAQAAWECGDPGMQYDTTVNDWHTCPRSGRINASNPCSEYMHIDNSACNLASINLLKYLKPNNTFDVPAFVKTVQTMILAQEIIVGASSYPTEKIEKNTHDLRQLGLGFANLGALLMALGMPYDSEEARALAGAITALMCGEAYRYSAEIARRMGPFNGFAMNREPMLRVMRKHGDGIVHINRKALMDKPIANAAAAAWKEALHLGEKYGYRNAQVTVIAPTGTIAFMMDCDTTGIEPEFALVKMKQLVGGGYMKIVNQTVRRALTRLGYAPRERQEIIRWIEEKGTAEGSSALKEKHAAVFDTAVRPASGNRSISWQGHVKMTAAVQPFISGAISKTFNMPVDATVDEIADAYTLGWKLGLKAFAVYRDGSKATQPLVTAASSTQSKGNGENKEIVAPSAPKEIDSLISLPSPAKELREGVRAASSYPIRRHLPATRTSYTHKFVISGHEGYLTYSTFGDGAPAEIFIRMAKQGSTLAGLLDAFAITVSTALQYGVPLRQLAQKFIYGRYEPAGVTENPDILFATSITDYIFRYLAFVFLTPDDFADLGIALARPAGGSAEQASALEKGEKKAVIPQIKTSVARLDADLAGPASQEEAGAILPRQTSVASQGAPLAKTFFAESSCRLCGGMVVRTGSCRTCMQCGTSDGGC